MTKEKSDNTNNYGLYIAITAVIMIVGLGYYMNQTFNKHSESIVQAQIISQNTAQRLNNTESGTEHNFAELHEQLDAMSRRLKKLSKRLEQSKGKTENTELDSDSDEDDPIRSRRNGRR